LPEYLAFYRADYHPDQYDHRALIAEWRDRLALQPAQTAST
jgi:predicted metal-dependent hydrolase